MRWTVTGTQEGAFAGIPVTDTGIMDAEWARYTVDGRLASVRAMHDELGILAGLGAVEWPPE